MVTLMSEVLMVAALLLVIAVILFWIWMDMPKRRSDDDFEMECLNMACPPSKIEKFGFGALKFVVIGIGALCGWFIISII